MNLDTQVEEMKTAIRDANKDVETHIEQILDLNLITNYSAGYLEGLRYAQKLYQNKLNQYVEVN
jgi:hypothetical protein